ncbi:Phage-related tail protein [Bathymodiolus thermophilus thioautotrophic gill symbiont]|uniref:hypothetical protein n=1 Tax=Bathymodiolus thermophilus thioautotrophic gill symbiont TaxID=2360 RepID=UPI0010BB2602|nr:hypothetical protein [Bathymodiolus thermophilus thioautotrophic gill symbiont]SGZ77132.1 Phage-related tail protein [Bathymodiolus thermophilus thioautotrophic gill symbiont]
MKILYKILALLAILALAIAFFINPIGKHYTQKYAQTLFKSPVEISQFSLHLFEKSLNIDFIKVQNPFNFKHKDALSLDHFLLKIGPINSHLIVIDEIKLDGLQFALEQNANQVNLTQLLTNLDKPDNNTLTSAKPTTQKSQKSQTKRIQIKHLEVRNISLKINTKWLKTTLKVPNISARNFGGSSGIPVDKIGKEVAKEILHNLKNALEKKGIIAGKKEIEANLRRQIEQKLGIKGSLDDIEKQFDTDDIKNKAKKLFKELGL